MQHDPLGKPLDGRDWITSQQAAELVGMCRVHFLRLARKQGLTRYHPPRQKFLCYLLRQEVETFLQQRKTRYDVSVQGRLIGEIDLQTAQTLFLTAQQAADLLGVARPTLYNMARRGTLAAFRATTDNVSGRLWFSRSQIENLRNDPKRNQRRQQHRNDRRVHAARMLGLTDDYPKHAHIPLVLPDKTIPRHWINTHRAAYTLGVSRQRIYALIREGRLNGYHRWKGDHFGRLWYLDQYEVEALRDDPTFAQRSRRYFRRMRKRYRDARQTESQTIAAAAAQSRRKLRDPHAPEFLPDTQIPW